MSTLVFNNYTWGRHKFLRAKIPSSFKLDMSFDEIGFYPFHDITLSC